MIITLKGANFSASNIGTLTTWNITKSLGAGATSSNNATTVTRGGSYSTTITLAADYEIGSAGVSITMGGLDITSTVSSISGNTISISISSVTGNVSIKVPTKNLTTGGESGGTDTPDVPVTPPSGGGTNATYYFKDLSIKGYLYANEIRDSETSRTTDYINVSHKPKIGYFGRMGFVEGMTYHAIEFYDVNKNYLSSLSILGTGTPSVVNIDLSDPKFSNVYYVRASVAQGSAYTTEQFNTWYFIVGGSASKPSSGGSGSGGSTTAQSPHSAFTINEYIAASTNTTASFGEMVSGNGGNAWRTDYISIAGKSTVNYTGRMGTIGCNYAFYDASKKVISGLELVGDGTTVTKTLDLTDSKYNNAVYIVASISKGSIADSEWAKSSFSIS